MKSTTETTRDRGNKAANRAEKSTATARTERVRKTRQHGRTVRKRSDYVDAADTQGGIEEVPVPITDEGDGLVRAARLVLPHVDGKRVQSILMRLSEWLSWSVPEIDDMFRESGLEEAPGRHAWRLRASMKLAEPEALARTAEMYIARQIVQLAAWGFLPGVELEIEFGAEPSYEGPEDIREDAERLANDVRTFWFVDPTSIGLLLVAPLLRESG